eukprot:TRINITY_DN4910_c0_g1_i2.p1 TRINITY_DN4910_c0_g1~~TRINITY_DN4910_c0_g1_i2.p1  ORF type:complete len:321 (-),score=59.89 TRINITY_DN4910_c0_g1_i2:105-1067(-)
MCRESIIVGSRGSALALKQTEIVQGLLLKGFKNLKLPLEIITTMGDKELVSPLPEIGGRGVFTKEIDNALLEQRIDIAVHSLKDIPTKIEEGLKIGAILKREDPHDCLVLREGLVGLTLETLPKGSVIGSSSLRRISQIKSKYDNLVFKDIRGNLQTRLKKLDSGEYDAIILAVAGLTRIDLASRISQVLSFDICLPAAGQGALAVCCRTDDFYAQLILSQIEDFETSLCCTAERSLLDKLQGGCSTPIGICGEINKEGELELRAVVLSLDGKEYVREMVKGKCAAIEDTEKLVLDLVNILNQKGAHSIIENVEKQRKKE